MADVVKCLEELGVFIKKKSQALDDSLAGIQQEVKDLQVLVDKSDKSWFHFWLVESRITKKFKTISELEEVHTGLMAELQFLSNVQGIFLEILTENRDKMVLAIEALRKSSAWSPT